MRMLVVPQCRSSEGIAGTAVGRPPILRRIAIGISPLVRLVRTSRPCLLTRQQRTAPALISTPTVALAGESWHKLGASMWHPGGGKLPTMALAGPPTWQWHIWNGRVGFACFRDNKEPLLLSFPKSKPGVQRPETQKPEIRNPETQTPETQKFSAMQPFLLSSPLSRASRPCLHCHSKGSQPVPGAGRCPRDYKWLYV